MGGASVSLHPGPRRIRGELGVVELERLVRLAHVGVLIVVGHRRPQEGEATAHVDGSSTTLAEFGAGTDHDARQDGCSLNDNDNRSTLPTVRRFVSSISPGST